MGVAISCARTKRVLSQRGWQPVHTCWAESGSSWDKSSLSCLSGCPSYTFWMWPKAALYGGKSAPETDMCEHAEYRRVLESPLLSLGHPGTLSCQCIEGGWTTWIWRLSCVVDVIDQMLHPGFVSLKIISSVLTWCLPANTCAIQAYLIGLH